MVIGGPTCLWYGTCSEPTTAADGGAPLAEDPEVLRQRLQDYRELLIEKGVTQFSVWDKELPKLISDPRYLGTLIHPLFPASSIGLCSFVADRLSVCVPVCVSA